ncbi:hypothetical protein [Deinococcus aquaedulcis]|uniref:hypothetical protein n=1 Tax=Deinococcus aquaedulcis TaxID=2840455 RepID=UPI001C838A03|nr:hypothetical protein [Deinococcus aquaedulcis]
MAPNDVAPQAWAALCALDEQTPTQVAAFSPAEVARLTQDLEQILEQYPAGSPDLPLWVQRLYQQGPEVVVETLVLLHLSALVLEVLSRARTPWTGELLDTALGVALSLYTVDLMLVPLGNQLEAGLFQLGARSGGSPLLPAEVPAAVRVLEQLARDSGVPVPETSQSETFQAWLDVLESHATRAGELEASWLPTTERVSRLLEWQQTPRVEEDSPEARVAQLSAAAAALALYVEVRSRLPLLTTSDLLQCAAIAVQAALSLSARHRLPERDLKSLWKDLQALHLEIGRPPLPIFKHGAVVPPNVDALHEARHALRRARHVQLRRPTARSRGLDAMLWDIFDDLHSRPLPYTPLDELTLAIAGRWALTQTPRCQGMALTDTVALAVELGQVEVLWAWPLREDHAEELSHALKTMTLLLLEWNDHADHPEVQALMRAATGHLLAVARRAGVGLPEASQLANLVGGSAVLRATPLGNNELHRLADQYLELQEALSRERPPVAEAAEMGTVEVQLEQTPQPEHLELSWPPHVMAARALLAGSRVVLLGGVPDPAHYKALVEAFDLTELDWIPSARYDHGLQAAAHLSKPGTSLAIFALRWGAHAHGSLRDAARDAGVPYLLHPAGLNPNQVAWQVMRQVSDTLASQIRA